MTAFHVVAATTFHIVTAATYWLLIAMWSFILVFYVARIRRQRLHNALFTTLIVVLAIDAFRTLFESIYFGIWYTALAELLPNYVRVLLEQPGAVLVPKMFNVIVAGLVILILLRRWIPEEEKEIREQQNRELHLQQEIAARTGDLQDTNERLRQEIVEHTSAVDALRKSEERLARTEEFSLIIVTHVALDGTWLKVPATLCQLLGYEEKDLLSNSFKAVTHPEDFEKDWQQCERLICGDVQSFELEKRYIHRDGTIVWIYQNCSVVKDEEGKPLHFLTYIRDITDNKKVELDRERLAGELMHAQKMEAVGRLAGGVAHEFNNRLMTIMGNTEIILSKLKSPAWHEHKDLVVSCVETIGLAGERSTMLTRQLLAFSHKPLTQPQLVNTRQLLTDVKATLKPLLGENIQLELDMASSVSAVYGDSGQLEQVITNIVLNARDSMESAGSVTVTCKDVDVSASLASIHPDVSPGPHVQISVSDDGVGISEEVIEHIFEPFFTTKPVGKGTGLGLAMVHGIVSQMKGFVTVESQVGVGTTFHVTLPVSTNEIIVEDKMATHDYSGNGEIILVGEDEPSVRLVITQILAGAGYAVLEAAHGEQAIDMARTANSKISLLVTDIVMPGMNGFELYKKISSEVAGLRTVFVSGYATNAIDDELMTSNQHAILQKPFKSGELLETVWHAIHGEFEKIESVN